MNKDKAKISVQIWREILKEFDTKMEASCLRRDAYLSKILRFELEKLDEEIIQPNSPEAYKYVSNQLDMLDRKLITLTIDTYLVEKLNDICTRKMIVRDAFFNRLFFMLVASNARVDRLFAVPEGWRTEIWEEHRNDFFWNVFNPLNEVMNPLVPIRYGIEEYQLDKFYCTVFPSLNKTNLEGLNTYFPDELVLGSEASKASEKSLDELLGIN